MSIPLDRLYQFVESVAQQASGERIVIYRFYPHGSKKLEDLHELHGDWPMADYDLLPVMYCHDQEPLMWNHYHAQDPEFNLRRKSRRQQFDQCLLLHSEQRSHNLQQYQSHDFVPVYYWSHALIARDWFRYAEYYEQTKRVQKIFLIYNRAWAGTREYRLKLMEHIVQLDLTEHCKTTVNAVEPELNIHYHSHEFVNACMRPQLVLENYFNTTTASSAASADFEVKDYESTEIEVVLETLFDDSRLQLTEKILRPIAVGQPFILAGTQGSLDYLRSYGFKTFDNIWDESYDNEPSAEKRLLAIADLMKTIGNWSVTERQLNQHAMQLITQHNRQHFFSQNFSDQVIRELTANIKMAHKILVSGNTGLRYNKYQNL